MQSSFAPEATLKNLINDRVWTDETDTLKQTQKGKREREREREKKKKKKKKKL
jgi:hypothetical protein